MTELPATPFLARDIGSLGLSRENLRILLRAGEVRRMLTGVYVRADAEDTPALRAACAGLVLPPHCVVADRSAAWLHGVDCYDVAELAGPHLLEVVSLRGNQPTRRAEVYGGERELQPDEICEIGGVRVTTPLRTACDLACQRGAARALAVLDAFRRAYALEIADFAAVLPRFTDRRGVKQLRRLIPLSSPLAESAAESWTRMVIIDESLPAPEPQLWVLVPGYGWVRVDMGWRHLKVCVEYDGEEFHTRAEDREHDERRREAMRRDGWIVIVVRKDGFSGPGRELWFRELKAAFAERSPAPGKRVYSRGEDNPAYRHLRRRR